jgi:integrase
VIDVRLRYGQGKQARFEVPDEARADALRMIARDLVHAKIDAERARRMLDDAAKASAGELRALQALVREITGGDTAPVANPARANSGGASETVAQYAERWFDDRERRGLSSVDTDRGRLEKHVLPLLGSKPLVSVSANDLRAVVEALDETVRRDALHWNTARKIWGLVTKMFSDTVRSKIAALRVRDDNPARDVQGPDDGEPTAKQWLYPAEVSALLACPDVPVRWRRLYALAIYLYLRPGELAALEWRDVQLGPGYVHVHQALDQRTGKAKATKTGVTRKVPIPRALRTLLEFLKGDGTPSGRVVRSDSAKRGAASKAHGMPPLEDLAATLREHLLRAGVDRAELHDERPTTKRVTFYDLRSTGITWEVLAGTEHLKIQQRAGHKSFSTTQGYIRSAEELGASIGDPFPPMPASLTTAPDSGGESEGESENGLGSESSENSRGKMRRPQRDLNPCYSLERAVSWAG